ncbi:MAG: hypothetical protein ACK4PR_11450, partial [Gammaproteobacteria bacterium]
TMPNNTSTTLQTLSYPINNTVKPAIYLSINIPAGFRALQSPTSDNVIAKFVPQQDDDYKWTQIITGVTIKNTQVTADELVKYMQTKFKEHATAVKIIDSTSTVHQDYQEACTTIDYNINKRHEIVYMCYYCGPDDCAGIQNAMLWPAGEKTTATDMAAKLKPFVENNVKVITQPATN